MTDNIESRTGSWDIARQQATLDRLKEHIDRIERRLELRDDA